MSWNTKLPFDFQIKMIVQIFNMNFKDIVRVLNCCISGDAREEITALAARLTALETKQNNVVYCGPFVIKSYSAVNYLLLFFFSFSAGCDRRSFKSKSCIVTTEQIGRSKGEFGSVAVRNVEQNGDTGNY